MTNEEKWMKNSESFAPGFFKTMEGFLNELQQEVDLQKSATQPLTNLAEDHYAQWLSPAGKKLNRRSDQPKITAQIYAQKALSVLIEQGYFTAKSAENLFAILQSSDNQVEVTTYRQNLMKSFDLTALLSLSDKWLGPQLFNALALQALPPMLAHEKEPENKHRNLGQLYKYNGEDLHIYQWLAPYFAQEGVRVHNPDPESCDSVNWNDTKGLANGLTNLQEFLVQLDNQLKAS